MTANFFDEQSDQSQVKSAIVSKYFWSWAKVITGYQKGAGKTPKVAYLDLFAGPGRYKSGAASTPLLILEGAIADPVLRDGLVTIFNDGDPDNASTLKRSIKELQGIETLKYQPSVYADEVGENMVKSFEKLTLIPTLFFVDPWGYRGLSLRLINSVLKDWGCECIFFFNYNRINQGLPIGAVKEHLDALFGAARGDALRKKLEGMAPKDRELTIVEEICQALKEMGGKYVLPFRFRNKVGTRTSHHLIFVSKHPLGYKIMKEVMANESSTEEQGVPSFEYSPASRKQPLLFELNRPLDDLEEMLQEEFAGRTLSMADVFEAHNYGRRYISKNYKSVLLKLEQGGKIIANPPHTKRPKRNGEITFADKVQVTFPKAREEP